jgi:hypothetical protein
MEYTTLSLAEVRRGLEDIAREAQATFGALTPAQLNWQPEATRWSVAQCFDHLLTANSMMFRAADEALDQSRSKTVWQRMPVFPSYIGRMMVRSQAPETTRRFSAPAAARPTASYIPGDVVQRFVEQQRAAATRAAALDERIAAQTIMSSPFLGIVTYSVLDGWRLIVAHGRRHFEQARRVTGSPGFPSRDAIPNR